MNLGNCLMTEKTVKHVQDQGRCKNNNEILNVIDEKLGSLSKAMGYIISVSIIQIGK